MPCWTVRKTTVDIEKMRVEILSDGLAADGFDVKLEGERLTFALKGTYLYHSYENGRLTLSGGQPEEVVARIKRAYSAQAVRVAANQFGWKLGAAKKSEQGVQFTAEKRR